MSRKLVKERKYHFIYKTTCSLTGKYYIGMHSTDNLEDGYLGSGKRLRYSVRKYGTENHTREILEFCSAREELASREAEIVNLNEIAKEECMNLNPGGEGGWGCVGIYPYAFNKEAATKFALAGNEGLRLKLKNDPEFKRKFQNIGKTSYLKSIKNGNCPLIPGWSGKKHTEETKLKMSVKAKLRTGEKNSQYGTCWITNGTENKKIKNNEIDTWTIKGWKRGRKI
jgi:hypothetical protein